MLRGFVSCVAAVFCLLVLVTTILAQVPPSEAKHYDEEARQRGQEDRFSRRARLEREEGQQRAKEVRDMTRDEIARLDRSRSLSQIIFEPLEWAWGLSKKVAPWVGKIAILIFAILCIPKAIECHSEGYRIGAALCLVGCIAFGGVFFWLIL